MSSFTISTTTNGRTLVFRAEGTGASMGDAHSLAAALSTIPRGREERLSLITESVVMARRHCFEPMDIAAAIAKGHEIADAEDTRAREEADED